MTLEIHQILPNLDCGDAISNHALEIRDILHARGYKSNIYAKMIHPAVADRCYYYSKHQRRSSKKNIIIFHYSIGSDLSEYVKSLPDRKIMIYHNITPPHFFAPFDSHISYLLKKGRDGLKEFASVPELALGDSQYNADELKGLGYRNVNVLPIIMNTKHLDISPDEDVIKKYNDGFTNIMFVGRVVPNKKFEDIIKVFYFYKRFINGKSRLFLVGPDRIIENYRAGLSAMIKKLGLEDAIFTGHITNAELAAYYKISHVFIGMSEHEGFCVPLLEAMYFNIPVVAFASSAVAETMGDAGIVFKDKKYEESAELIDIVLSDTALREKIIASQRKRLLDFDKEKIAEKLISYVEGLHAAIMMS